MYGKIPHQVVELREAKKHELFHCVPCNKTFKRRDNLNRHMRSGLHGRRVAQYAMAKIDSEKTEEKKEEPKVVDVAEVKKICATPTYTE